MQNSFQLAISIWILSLSSSTEVSAQKSRCFCNENSKIVMLKIDDGEHFVFVSVDDVTGGRYYEVEKGLIINNEFGLTFKLTSYVVYDKNYIEFSKEEDLSDTPLTIYGKSNKKGVYVRDKGGLLKELPCKKRIFSVLRKLTKE